MWLKLAQWFLKSRFLHIVNVILLFCYYLPFENGVALHLLLLSPLGKGRDPSSRHHSRMMLCIKFEIGQVVLKKKLKM